MSKIDLSNPPKYLRQTTTGRIYAFSEFKAKRGDMEPYEMPQVVQEKENSAGAAGVAGAETKTGGGDDLTGNASNAPVPDGEGEMVGSISIEERRAKIKAAIAQIPAEEFNKPAMGRPAIPKVKQVSELAGFKVAVEEIVAAITAESSATPT